ncbi:MAG: hypothetical protein IPK83_01975 [Planctomycetes bacterium]|nr:hypothetical protein [Planctomycetota bacterium]
MAIGSVAPMIGRVGAAMSLASVVKAAICLHRRTSAPVRALGGAAAIFEQSGSRLHRPLEASYWYRDRVNGPRRALAASMTMDGQAAHVVLEEAASTRGEAAVPVLNYELLKLTVESAMVMWVRYFNHCVRLPTAVWHRLIAGATPPPTGRRHG